MSVKFNQKCTLKTTIAFVKKYGPMILTCRHHNIGTKNLYLHPPWKPDHIFPPKRGDKVSFCVITPRTINPKKS